VSRGPGLRGLSLRGVGYRYPSVAAPTVSGVELAVAPGEILLLTGPTGCGKSTLLRLAAGLLQRHGQGQVQGEVAVDGRDPAALAPSERVRALGLVGQEPGDQLVAGTVGDEIAFAMESAGWSAAAIEAALPALQARVGLDLALDRDPRTLSGGQTQRLVIAAALSAGAGTLVLDEPLAQLDPAGAEELLRALRTIADGGVAVLLVEHRLEACLPVVDRVAIMAEGRLVDTVFAAALRPGSEAVRTLRALGLVVPGRLDLADRLAPRQVEAVTFRPPGGEPPVLGETLWEGRGLGFTWRGAPGPALVGVDLRLRAGERVALLGGNGAGKSTLLGLLSGQLRSPGLRPPAGVVAVPQDPDLALFCPTVQEELAVGPREGGHADVAGQVDRAAAALSVAGLRDRPPQALSRGQRLRVAVAAALACAPRVLLLDEPTSGQDHDQVERMMSALVAALSGGALVFATHDVDLALRHATTVYVLDQGRIVAAGTPAGVMAALPLPPLARLCRDRGLPPATAAELAAWAEGA